jgi:hypothetical protein
VKSFKHLVILGLSTLFALQPQAWAQTQKLTKKVAAPPPQESGFGNSLTFIQIQPAYDQRKPLTIIDEKLSYDFNDDWSSTVGFTFTHIMNEPNNQNANRMDDIFIDVTRANIPLDFEDDTKLSLSSGLTLPTSQSSIESGSKGGIYFNPMITKKVQKFTFLISSNMMFFAQKTSPDFYIEESDGTVFEPYDSIIQYENMGKISYKLSKSFTYDVTGKYFQGETAKGDLSRTYNISTGLGFKVNQNIILKTAIRTSDRPDSENPMFNYKNSSLSLVMNVSN